MTNKRPLLDEIGVPIKDISRAWLRRIMAVLSLPMIFCAGMFIGVAIMLAMWFDETW